VSKEIPELIAHVDYPFGDNQTSSGIIRVIFDDVIGEDDRENIKSEFKEFVENITGENVCVGWENECFMCDGRDGEHNSNCCEHPDFNPELCIESEKNNIPENRE